MTTDGGERQMYCGALFSPCWTGQRYEINPSSGVLWHQRLIGILLFEHLKPNDIVLRLTICSKRQGKEMCRLPFASQLPLKYLCAVSESIGKKIVFYFSSLHLSISLLDKNISQFFKTGGVHILLIRWVVFLCCFRRLASRFQPCGQLKCKSVLSVVGWVVVPCYQPISQEQHVSGKNGHEWAQNILEFYSAEIPLQQTIETYVPRDHSHQ